MTEYQNIHLHVSDSAFIGGGRDPQALEENITHKSLRITAASIKFYVSSEFSVHGSNKWGVLH
jgi:hypothetical protein